MKKVIALTTALLVSPFVHAGVPGPDIIFHCVTTKGKEVLLGTQGDQVGYMFGKDLNNPELQFANPIAPGVYTLDAIGSHYAARVNLARGNTRYVVFESDTGSGISVYSGQKLLTTIDCQDDSVKSSLLSQPTKVTFGYSG